MTKKSDDRRRRLLESLLSGELDPRGEEGRGHLKNDLELRARFEELHAVAERIDEAVAEQDELLAATPPEGEDARQAREALEAIWGERPARPKLWIGIAAGMLLAAILGFAILEGDGSPNREDPIELGSELLRGTAPDGEVDQFTEFHWESDLLPGYRFELVFTDLAGHVLDTEPGLLASPWTLPEARALALPDSIRWYVIARMIGSGEEAGKSVALEAHRIPR